MSMLPPKIWQYQNPNRELSLNFAIELNIPPLVARLLVNRGIKSIDEAKTYLYPTYTDLHSPFKMADMEKAVERIRQAIKKGEKICIYGDYDADGTTATALLVNAFRHIDYPVDYYIPHRYDEGYGLNKEAVKEIATNGCSLMITVDCGITSINEVKLANELSMDIVLTDHHQPPESDPPPAYAIISPKVSGNEYPYLELAGVGLAFKLAQGLIDDETYLTSLLDLVVLGTVVDLAPLTGENRTLSRLGLAEINRNQRIGIKKLCEVAGYNGKPLFGQTLSYVLGPRLNAAGRMDTAKTVVELLTTDSPDSAVKLAQELDKCNQDRKDIEIKIQEKAVELLHQDDNFEQSKGLVVASSSWGEHAKGVVGIVASRLKEQFYRPVFVLTIDGQETSGSGRSIDGLNLADSLNSCSELLIKHGGHKAAAGVTLKTENLNKFKNAFNKFACDHLNETDLIPKLDFDFETNLSSLTLETLEQFKLLEPFGLSNPSPCFVSKDLNIEVQPSLMGTDQQHIRMSVSEGNQSLRTIGWRKAQHLTTLNRKNISLDMAFSPEINDYQGVKSVQLILEEFRVNDRAPDLQVFPPSDTPSIGKVVDYRNQNKKDILFSLLNSNKGCIIYVQNTQKINQLLTSVIVDKASYFGRHDETTTELEEIALLEKVKNGDYIGIVSSGKFSETALKSVPVIDHIVFCHLTVQPDMFYSRCKPISYTQNTTFIHLLYNTDSDVKLFHECLDNIYPDRNQLANFYRELNENTNSEYTNLDRLNESFEDYSVEEIDTRLTIFEELGFIERKSDNEGLHFRLLHSHRQDLDMSKTYRKCALLKLESQDFMNFQLERNCQQIWERITDECEIPNQ
ncbi:MAG: single-stranded-DNA-specific exonuclease RecJ [Candidatus Poribacteria bacterium]|nr:single-stranded-DNA-specific exonuclease RecJ [Candidatus Poribacteria bacterium]